MQISSKISIVLIRTISQYLESHKRLVVPQLGTFIVKEPGVSIVFSELLKRDDGTLRRLLIDGGLSELEAAGRSTALSSRCAMPWSTAPNSGSTVSA